MNDKSLESAVLTADAPCQCLDECSWFEFPEGASRRGVLVIGPDGRITSIDKGIAGLLAVNGNDLIGRQLDEAVKHTLMHCFVEAESYEASWRRIREQPDAVLEEVLHLVGLEHRPIHRYSTPMIGNDGVTMSRIEVYSDITMRRRLESAVKHAYDNLRAAQEQLVHSEKLKAVGEIASGVAHDFNNTLGIILGNIQLLLRIASDEGTRARLSAAERAALDAVETVSRIKESVKASSQPASVVDLSRLAFEVVEMMEPTWQEAGNNHKQKIEVMFDLNTPVFVAGNAAELRESLINIVQNAVQAMPDGGTITISTGYYDSSGWIKVADTGIGMSEEARSRVFDPFFTTRGSEGTGLGMSVVYSIIKRHSGNISVDSQPGKGTIVTISFPIAVIAGHDRPELEPASGSQSPSRKVGSSV